MNRKPQLPRPLTQIMIHMHVCTGDIGASDVPLVVCDVVFVYSCRRGEGWTEEVGIS